MQRTADFHNQVANAGRPEAAGAMDDATALDAAVNVLDAHEASGDAPIHRFLRAPVLSHPREYTVFRLFPHLLVIPRREFTIG